MLFVIDVGDVNMADSKQCAGYDQQPVVQSQATEQENQRRGNG